jgi:hypothetical protein
MKPPIYAEPTRARADRQVTKSSSLPNYLPFLPAQFKTSHSSPSPQANFEVVNGAVIHEKNRDRSRVD